MPRQPTTERTNLNVLISREIIRQVKLAAVASGKPLNQYVEHQLANSLSGDAMAAPAAHKRRKRRQ